MFTNDISKDQESVPTTRLESSRLTRARARRSSRANCTFIVNCTHAKIIFVHSPILAAYLLSHRLSHKMEKRPDVMSKRIMCQCG